MKKILLLIASVMLIGTSQLDAQNNVVTFTNYSTGWSYGYFDFGNVTVGSSSSAASFDANFASMSPPGGAPVTVTAPSGFEISLDNATYTNSTTIPVTGASFVQTIYVRFSPTTTGYQDGLVEFIRYSTLMNSPDYEPWVAGTGDAATAPEIDIQGNNTSIPDGSTTPLLIDHTDFGSIAAGATRSRTYTIYNTGDANLTLTDQGGGSYVLIGGQNSANFSVTTQPSTPIAPSGSTTFTVQFDPAGVADYYQATISIGNNDSDENPYNFAIAGTATSSAPTVSATTDAHNITSTQAVSGGNISSNGGSSITDQGVCYAEYSDSSDPTTADFTKSASTTGVGSYTVTLTGLSCGTRYEYLAYAMNTSGTAYGPLVKDFWTLSEEPDAQTSSLTASGYSTTQITLEFDALNSINNANRYLITMEIGSAPDETPADGNIYSSGELDGEFLVIITDESATSYTVGSLTNTNDYYFKIYPYNVCDQGTLRADVAATANYLTSPTRVTNTYPSPTSATWAGTGSWSNTSNWTPRMPGIDTDVTINNTEPSELAVDQNVTVNNFTISADGHVTLGSGKTLTVSGNFEIQSDGSGTGSYLDQGTTSIAGTTTVKQYLSLGQRYFVSTPTSGATFADLQSSPNSSHDFYWYQESENLWRDLNDNSSTSSLVNGRGYEIYYGSNFPDPDGLGFNGVYFNDGTMYNANASPTITYSGPEPTMIGWNLVGNPFPVSIDWDVTGWTKTNLYGSVYTWNGSQYISWNGSTGGITNGIIPPMSAFFVRANATGAHLTIPRAARVHDPQPHYKNQLADLLVLQVEGNGYEDKTYINFAKDATSGFDNYHDAFKLPGLEAAPQLYSDIGTEVLSINVLPYGQDQYSVQLGFESGAEGIYEIHAQELESFTDASILLVDSQEDVTIDLNTTQDYSFFASPGDDPHRFTVLFSGPFGIENPATETEEMKIYAYDRNIFVDNTENLRGEVAIFNVIGQKTSTHGLEGGLNRIPVNAIPGYYIVKVVTPEKVVTEKVYIK